MQKLKKILIGLSIISLSGCKNQFPAIDPQERCVSVLLEEKIIEEVPYYSGYCRCGMYEWTSDRIGRVGDNKDYELAKCNKLIGFTPDTYVNVYTWWEEIRLWLNRQK
jgi:hypothetical protein